MRKLYKMINNKKGFTLIELIIVIAIIGILAAIVIPRFTGFQDRARGTEAVVHAKQIATAIDVFFVDHNTWPVEANEDEIITAAGIPAGGNIAFGTDGGFTYTDADGHSAGRTDADHPVR